MRKRKKSNLPPGDDGRVIAPMDVEGMPWSAPARQKRPAPIAGAESPEAPERTEPPLTKEESRYYTWGALKAALLVVLVLCGGIVLFVLFCQFVWFR